MQVLRIFFFCLSFSLITSNIYAQSEYVKEGMLGTGFTASYVKCDDINGFALSAGASVNNYLDFGLSFVRTTSNNDISTSSFAPYVSFYLLKKYFTRQNIMLAFHGMIQHDSYSFPDDYGYFDGYGYICNNNQDSKTIYSTGLALTVNFFTDQEISLQLSGRAFYVNMLDYNESKHLMIESGISFCLHTKKDLIVIIHTGLQNYDSDYTYSVGMGLVFEKLKR